LFFCSLRAHTVIVCPQLCAAISEGDTEWSLCIQQTGTEPGDTWAEARIQEVHWRDWCCLKMPIHLICCCMRYWSPDGLIVRNH
jgi:hypothetical protein